MWRRLPSLHPSRWCGWHLSQPAGCWSRSGSHQGWSSSGETWEMRSTASPGHVESRHGHSYKPWPPEETPPDQDTHSWKVTIGCHVCHMSHLQTQSLALNCLAVRQRSPASPLIQNCTPMTLLESQWTVLQKGSNAAKSEISSFVFHSFFFLVKTHNAAQQPAVWRFGCVALVAAIVASLKQRWRVGNRGLVNSLHTHIFSSLNSTDGD